MISLILILSALGFIASSFFGRLIGKGAGYLTTTLVSLFFFISFCLFLIFIEGFFYLISNNCQIVLKKSYNKFIFFIKHNIRSIIDKKFLSLIFWLCVLIYFLLFLSIFSVSFCEPSIESSIQPEPCFDTQESKENNNVSSMNGLLVFGFSILAFSYGGPACLGIIVCGYFIDQTVNELLVPVDSYISTPCLDTNSSNILNTEGNKSNSIVYFLDLVYNFGLHTLIFALNFSLLFGAFICISALSTSNNLMLMDFNRFYNLNLAHVLLVDVRARQDLLDQQNAFLFFSSFITDGASHEAALFLEHQYLNLLRQGWSSFFVKIFMSIKMQYYCFIWRITFPHRNLHANYINYFTNSRFYLTRASLISMMQHTRNLIMFGEMNSDSLGSELDDN